jgi:hypothetical protein
MGWKPSYSTTATLQHQQQQQKEVTSLCLPATSVGLFSAVIPKHVYCLLCACSSTDQLHLLPAVRPHHQQPAAFITTLAGLLTPPHTFSHHGYFTLSKCHTHLYVPLLLKGPAAVTCTCSTSGDPPLPRAADSTPSATSDSTSRSSVPLRPLPLLLPPPLSAAAAAAAAGGCRLLSVSLSWSLLSPPAAAADSQASSPAVCRLQSPCASC